MKLIKVTYRAVFQQPIGVLNPMGLKLPGPCPVEIYGSGTKWRIREIASAKQVQYVKLYEHPSASAAMEAALKSFEVQREPWQTWGQPPMTAADIIKGEVRYHPARILEPDEIKTLTKEGIERVYWKEAEDYTHIIHAPTLEAKAKVPAAACGAKVPAECFISTKANMEPTCKECAEVWAKHYQEKQTA